MYIPLSALLFFFIIIVCACQPAKPAPTQQQIRDHQLEFSRKKGMKAQIAIKKREGRRNVVALGKFSLVWFAVVYGSMALRAYFS